MTARLGSNRKHQGLSPRTIVWRVGGIFALAAFALVAAFSHRVTGEFVSLAINLPICGITGSGAAIIARFLLKEDEQVQPGEFKGVAQVASAIGVASLILLGLAIF